jgi:CubicO group peptidase (beta-lactamase class C family)
MLRLSAVSRNNTYRGGGILSRANARAMMTNQIGEFRVNVESSPSWGFGFGGAVLVNSELLEFPWPVGTWKLSGLYGHHWFVDPINLSVVAFSNTAIEGMNGEFTDELLRAIYSGQ